MYMPLCRECHVRETKLNKDNVYKGDPSLISVEFENEQFAEKSKQEKTQDKKLGCMLSSMSDNSTGTNDSESPKAKSFDSDLGEEILLKKSTIDIQHKARLQLGLT